MTSTLLGTTFKVSQSSANALGNIFFVNGGYNSGTGFTSNDINRLPGGHDSGITMSTADTDPTTTWADSTYQTFYFDVNDNGICDAGELFGIQYLDNSMDSVVTIDNLVSGKYHYLLFVIPANENKTINVSYDDGSGVTSTDVLMNSGIGVYYVEVLPATITSMQVTFYHYNGVNPDARGIVFYGIAESTTQITSMNFPCFLEDAMIKTTNGEIKIKDIEPGDKVYNGSGEIVTVKNVWYKPCFHVENGEHVYPYLIEKNTFGNNVPNNNLYISPHHGVYPEGINGPMITASKLGLVQEEIRTPFTYYCIDLVEGYGTMIVNGVICETYCSEKNNNLLIYK